MADQTADGEAPLIQQRWLAILFGIASFAVVLCWPTPAGLTVEGQRLAAVTVLMAIFWVAQPIPIAATSLIPLALYPLLGILSASETCRGYADRNVLLFLGGFIIALSIERWGLHRRIALHITSRIGSSPKRLTLGFMLATALLSMWISNTASTLLMLPIALALLSTLRETGGPSASQVVDRLTVPLLLGIAYAASCGGVATFVGTPTNLSLRGFWERQFVPEGYAPLSLAEWMAVFVPLTVLMLASASVVMTIGLKPFPDSARQGRNFFRNQLTALGPATPAERRVFVVFVITALLWILRRPLLFGDLLLLPDWPGIVARLAGWFGHDTGYLAEMVDDSTIAVAMAVLLFLLPCGQTDQPKEPLIRWKHVEQGVSWGMLLLIGSGFTMADAFNETELAAWLGIRFAEVFTGQPLLVLIVGVCLMLTFLTEFTTNVATVNTLLPTLAAMSVELGIDPRLLLIPATVSASCAFMLPVATPPNAIVFGSGKIPMQAMIRYGLVLNLLGAVFVTTIMLVLGTRIMQIPLPGSG
jgi:solute carrier family 13 (sodium-dependent dicarboxylate transporter), member 2/3/5